jgi:phage/plasmid primase-like uncharacterized protein
MSQAAYPSSDPMVALRDAMDAAGIKFAGGIIADGKLQRVYLDGHRKGSKNGWYVAHEDTPASAAFGDYKNGISETWSEKRPNSMTDGERDALRRRMEDTRRQRAEELAEAHRMCRDAAAAIWAAVEPASPEHPYLLAKGVSAVPGLKQLARDVKYTVADPERPNRTARKGVLVVPIWSADKVLHSVQTIDADGRKHFLSGTNKRGHYHSIGRLTQRIIIAEGTSTAATIHQATGCCVVIAFDAGNLMPVARAIRAKFPTHEIVLGADNDRQTMKPVPNPGMTKACEAAAEVNGLVAWPEFDSGAMLPNGNLPTDFNDLAAVRGNLESVTAAFEAAMRPSDIEDQVDPRHDAEQSQEPLLDRQTDAHAVSNVFSLDDARMDRGSPAQQEVPPIAATLHAWRDPSSIPPREWIYGRFLCRGYVSALISPGGIGKSTLIAADAVAMATGRQLVADEPHEPLRVWIWNGEDPADETERRVAAVVLHHRIEPTEIEGQLFVDTGREMPIKIATASKGGTAVAAPVVEALVNTITANRIDVLIVDPFVSAHDVPENDNGAIDSAVKAFALVAHRTRCAILLVHHSRKLNGADADIDSARGGSAIAAAVRSARVLNVMSSNLAKSFGISETMRRFHVRVDDAKANLAPATVATWFQLTGVLLGNATAERPGDEVAAAAGWKPPDFLAGLPGDAFERARDAVAGKGYAESVQSKKIAWVGIAIGEALGMNAAAEPDATKIKTAINFWLSTGALVRRTERINGKPVPTIDVSDRSE